MLMSPRRPGSTGSVSGAIVMLASVVGLLLLVFSAPYQRSHAESRVTTTFLPNWSEHDSSERMIDLDAWLATAVRVAFDLVETRAIVASQQGSIIPGSLRAATDGTCVNYEYTWVRDQALTFMALLNEYEVMHSIDPRRERYERMFNAYVSHAHAVVQHQHEPKFSLGAAKWLMDGSVFPGHWCTPQNDGPALRSTALMRFATRYVNLTGRVEFFDEVYKADTSQFPDSSYQSPIKRDLEYTAHNTDEGAHCLWQFPDHSSHEFKDCRERHMSCEPWEEVRAPGHFYNRMAMHSALTVGAAFAAALGDDAASGFYNGQADRLKANITRENLPVDHGGNYEYDDDDRFLIRTTVMVPESDRRKNDVQKILAIIHTHQVHVAVGETVPNTFLSPIDDNVLFTAHYIINSFEDSYFSINAPGAGPSHLGVAIGRYRNDKYNGNDPAAHKECTSPEVCPGLCGGQPWFLATNAIAELSYGAAELYLKSGRVIVSDASLAFFRRIGCGREIEASGGKVPFTLERSSAETGAGFERVIMALVQFADAQLMRVAYHGGGPDAAFFDEQFNADTGIMMSAKNLTWSYASLITAAQVRDRLDVHSLFASFNATSSHYVHAGTSAHLGNERSVQVRIAVEGVPSDTKSARVLFLDSFPYDANGTRARARSRSRTCTGPKLYMTRHIRDVKGALVGQWSAFVTVPKDSLIAFKVELNCDGPSSIPYQLEPGAPSLLQTASTNRLYPHYHFFGRSSRHTTRS